MQTVLYLIPILGVLVILLIWASLTNKQRIVYFLKPASTLTVIAMALFSFFEPTHNTIYSILVLVGLLLSLGGDVALMLPDKPRAFLVGLVLFLLAHIAYIIAFGTLASYSNPEILSLAILLVIGVTFYAIIKPGLGKMRIPVIVYMLIISIMVNRAIATTNSPIFSTNQVWMVAIGAVFFYISDV
ncbi:MAG: lysoplasmalogenase, partial [Anaerolineales bacterium]